MHWTRRTLLAAGAAGAMAPAVAWAEADRQPLWEIRKGGAKVYLCGDCGSVTVPWASPHIESAFDRSSVFWQEAPDPTPADRAKYVAAGVDRARPLSTWLTPQQHDRVAAAAQSVGTTYASLEPLAPWLAAILMSSAYDQRRKTASSDPLMVLGPRAKTAGKAVRSEFADTQALIDWCAGMPPAAQVQYLLYQIDSNEAPPENRAHREAAWAVGDMGPETQEMLRMQRTYPALYQSLAVERNRRWPDRVRKMLEDGGTTFILVGSDHLLGPDSTLVQLSAAGLTAKRI